MTVAEFASLDCLLDLFMTRSRCSGSADRGLRLLKHPAGLSLAVVLSDPPGL